MGFSQRDHDSNACRAIRHSQCRSKDAHQLLHIRDETHLSPEEARKIRLADAIEHSGLSEDEIRIAIEDAKRKSKIHPNPSWSPLTKISQRPTHHSSVILLDAVHPSRTPTRMARRKTILRQQIVKATKASTQTITRQKRLTTAKN